MTNAALTCSISAYDAEHQTAWKIYNVWRKKKSVEEAAVANDN
jgi:hypothetical protein